MCQVQVYGSIFNAKHALNWTCYCRSTTLHSAHMKEKLITSEYFKINKISKGLPQYWTNSILWKIHNQVKFKSVVLPLGCNVNTPFISCNKNDSKYFRLDNKQFSVVNKKPNQFSLERKFFCINFHAVRIMIYFSFLES